MLVLFACFVDFTLFSLFALVVCFLCFPYLFVYNVFRSQKSFADKSNIFNNVIFRRVSLAL